jgi:hypothetical protein
MSIAGIGVLALVGVGTGAGTANAAGIVSGTGTLTVSQSYLLTLARAHIFVTANSAQSVTYNRTAKTVTVVYSVTGGDANVNTFAGAVQYRGGITLYDWATGKKVQLGSLQFDLFNDQFDGTASDGTVVNVLDTDGVQAATANGPAQTFTASALTIDAGGASYLDSALGTTAFNAGDQVGSFATSYSY